MRPRDYGRVSRGPPLLWAVLVLSGERGAALYHLPRLPPRDPLLRQDDRERVVPARLRDPLVALLPSQPRRKKNKALPAV